MRQLETFTEENQAHNLAAFMLSEEIETVVRKQNDGQFVLWVYDDTQLSAARNLLELFVANSESPEIKERISEAKKQKVEVSSQTKKSTQPSAQPPIDFQLNLRFGMGSLFFVLTGVGIYIISTLTDISGLMAVLAFSKPNAPHVFDSILSGEIWRLITPIFIPTNSISFFFSGLFLLFLGTTFEQKHKTRFMILLTILSAALSNALTSSIFGVQAAGTLTGVNSAFFAYLWVRHKRSPLEWSLPPFNTTFWIPFWFIVSLVLANLRRFAVMDIAGFFIGGIIALIASRK